MPRSGDGHDSKIPWPQVILDDVFLLLFLGVAVPFLLYIVWGLMELANLPSVK